MRRQRIDTIHDAIGFLRRSGVEVIGITRGWVLRSVDDGGSYEELTCDSGRELIAWARVTWENGLAKRISTCRSHPLRLFAIPSYSSAMVSRQTLLSDWTGLPMSNTTKEVKA